MPYSEIFENYAKIAEEQGLVSKADDSPSIKRYKKSPAPRSGSDSIEKIEKLYNVKPDTIHQYENNIIEVAHPEPVVISPAYDRLNGLVENENERNNIMVNIVNKPVDGFITWHRYAKEDLLMELIRIANDLDNRGSQDLRKLADSCIDKLANDSVKKKSSFRKEALAFLPIVGIMAVVVAATWLWQHVDDPDRGLSNNIDNAIKKLNDLKTNSWWESDVDEAVQQNVDKLIKDLTVLNTAYKQFSAIMNEIEKPTSLDAEQMPSLRQTAAEHGEELSKFLNQFVAIIDTVTKEIIQNINNFSSKEYQEAHSKPSIWSKMTGYVGEALHGRYGLFSNDFISAVNTLNAVKDSLQSIRTKAANIENVKQQAADQINKQLVEFKDKSTKQSVSPIRPQNDEEFEDDISKDFSQTSKMLGL